MVFKAITREVIIGGLYGIMVKRVFTALTHVHGLKDVRDVKELERRLGLSLKEAFKRDLIDSGLISEKYLELFNKLERLYNEVVEEEDMEKKGRKLRRLDEGELRKLQERVEDFEDEIEKVIDEVVRTTKNCESSRGELGSSDQLSELSKIQPSLKFN
jgi:predicted ribosome quality control (RQC) complex YloA/Tae2 family protein